MGSPRRDAKNLIYATKEQLIDLVWEQSDGIDQLRTERDRLRAENAELRKDRERCRQYRSEVQEVLRNIGVIGSKESFVLISVLERFDDIDAAMSEDRD